MKKILTIEELVRELGGREEIALRFGIVPGNISNWEAQGYIPQGWHLRLWLWAVDKGLDVHPHVFDMREDAFAPIAKLRPDHFSAKINHAPAAL
ncbi:MAG: hypothetical protein RIC14_00165 [Filomicrobium sp.]